MKRITRKTIENIAVDLLLKQDIKGEFALSLLDCRKIITGGKATISSIASYERLIGASLPTHPEGMTIKYGDTNIILYDDTVKKIERINWTVAHELGHIFLDHKDDSPLSQRQANLFASSFLMPEAVIRFLDCQKRTPITAEEMASYFAASFTACKKRRLELDRSLSFIPSEKEIELVFRLFDPEKI